jgi:hypothetical protein
MVEPLGRSATIRALVDGAVRTYAPLAPVMVYCHDVPAAVLPVKFTEYLVPAAFRAPTRNV